MGVHLIAMDRDRKISRDRESAMNPKIDETTKEVEIASEDEVTAGVRRAVSEFGEALIALGNE